MLLGEFGVMHGVESSLNVVYCSACWARRYWVYDVFDIDLASKNDPKQGAQFGTTPLQLAPPTGGDIASFSNHRFLDSSLAASPNA